MMEVTPLDLGPELTKETLNEFDEELAKMSEQELAKEGVSKEELKDFANDAVELSRMNNLYEFMFTEYLEGSIAFLEDIKKQPLEEQKKLKEHWDKVEKIKNQHIRRTVLSPSYSGVLRIIAGKNNHRQALLLITAIRKYELKYNKTPQSFKDMISGAVLTEIPKDMWTGKNLKVNVKQRYVEFSSMKKGKAKKCQF